MVVINYAIVARNIAKANFGPAKRNRCASFQDIRVLSSLRTKYGDDLLEQTLTVCSGLDMVNIYNCYFVFPSKKVMEVRLIGKTNYGFSRFRISIDVVAGAFDKQVNIQFFIFCLS